jgi:general secretion pathway protein K
VGAFASTISALRIQITVRDGRTEFRLMAIIAPPNGATTVQATATSTRTQTDAAAAKTAEQRQTMPNAAQQPGRPAPGAAGSRAGVPAAELRYPFALLEIRENDEIPPPPPPPPNKLI